MSRFEDRARLLERPKSKFTPFQEDNDSEELELQIDEIRFVDRTHPVRASFQQMLDLIEDFEAHTKNLEPVEKPEPIETYGFHGQNAPLNLTRQVSMSRHFQVDRNRLQSLHAIFENEQAFANTLLMISDARFSDTGYQGLTREESLKLNRCVLKEVLVKYINISLKGSTYADYV